MPLKYYVTEIQAREWQDRINEAPDDWKPNEKQAEAIRLAQAQFAHFHENSGRILTDEEVELIADELMGRRPAPAYELDRYEGKTPTIRDEVDSRVDRMRPGYTA